MGLGVVYRVVEGIASLMLSVGRWDAAAPLHTSMVLCSPSYRAALNTCTYIHAPIK